MYHKDIANNIWEYLVNTKDPQCAKDLMKVVTADIEDKDAQKMAAKLDEWIEDRIPKEDNGYNIEELYYIHHDLLKIYARVNFDAYCRYIEWDRDPDKKFYMPRRKQLRHLAEEMQRLFDNEIDLLCISLAPGVGKTCLALFFITWWTGRQPEKEIITASHNNAFLEGAYDEILRIMEVDGEYKYSEVFPESPVVGTNAKNMMIDVKTERRFSALEFSSVGSGNAGKIRASSLLYCDDLVSGIEEAMSKDRLAKLWDSYIIDLRQRMKGDCRQLMIATRWSLYDPIGRLEAENENDPRAVFIREPALDENDESRFDYPYGVGFSTEFYRKQRATMCSSQVGTASWNALYMAQPIEIEGVLYDRSELRRYFELPEEEPDAIIAVCDTKDKGDDYAVLPIGYVYGEDHYIVDPVCSDAKIEVVKTMLAKRLFEHKVQQARFEHNVAGGQIAEQIQERVKAFGGNTKITTKYTTANKETKIVVNSDWVKEHCLFLDDSVITANNLVEYRRFLDMLCGYSIRGRNKHDDVPDAMAMYALYAQTFEHPTVKILKRIF